MEVTIVDDSRVEPLGVGHDDFVGSLGDRTSSTPILSVNYQHLISIENQTRYIIVLMRLPYSYKLLITRERFFWVPLCRLEMAVHAVRIA